MTSPVAIIEFLGLPGSGKTTIANQLARHLCASDVAVLTRSHALADEWLVFQRHLKRARYVISTAMRTPRPFLRALRLIREDGQHSLRATLKVCWNLWCVMGWYGWLSRNHQGMVIVDQGLAQAVWSVRLSALRAKADWVGFLRECGMIDAMVITDCDPSVLEARLSARDGQISRLSGRSLEDRYWQVAQNSFAEGCAEVETLVPTMRVRNEITDDPAQLVKKIADWLWVLAAQKSWFEPEHSESA